MKLQRLAIILLVMGLVAGLEGMMLRTFTGSGGGEQTVEATPVPSAEPTEQVQITPAPPATIPTMIPDLPGFTSPPAGSSGGNGGSSSGNASPTKAPAKATEKPKPTAKPTDPPPPTEAPGTSVGSGSFSSNTGASLNISVSWEAKDQGNDTCRVYINGSVNSYSLEVGSRPVSISFGGYSTSVMGKSLNVSSNSMTSSSLFSTYIDVPSGTSGTMTVSWNYNGTYSEVQIGEVVASGGVYTS